MRYTEEDVRQALHILDPYYDSYELDIEIVRSFSGFDEGDKSEYKVYRIKKSGKKEWLVTYGDNDIRRALDSLRKVYGYCRISRPQQSIDRQIRNIKTAYPNAFIVQESYTGTKMDRPEWNKLLKTIQVGDTIVFDSVSRMSRNSEEGVETYFSLYEKGIKLIFLKEHYIDTDTYSENMKDRIELRGTDEDEIFKGLNNYFRKLAEKQIRIAFDQSEKEVQDLHQRTKEGIMTARLNGKQIGQKPGNKLNVKKEAPAKEKIRRYSKDFDGSLSDPDCIKLVGVSRNTYYKYKRELRE